MGSGSKRQRDSSTFIVPRELDEHFRRLQEVLTSALPHPQCFADEEVPKVYELPQLLTDFMNWDAWVRWQKLCFCSDPM